MSMRLILGQVDRLAAGVGQGLPDPHSAAGQFLWREYYGNELWRYLLLLGVILLTLVAGRVVRFVVERAAVRLKRETGISLLELFLRCLSRPAVVGVYAVGFYLAHFCLRFASETQPRGFSAGTQSLWDQVARALFAIAIAYFIYRLVDIIEHYLRRWASRTDTGLDDMLVSVIRKTLRVFIAVVAVLFIADNILELKLGAVLATAGIGGLAIALAAQETIANFFGSVTIFADRPFQVGDRIKVGIHDGPVEEVGFRSTRIRTVEGHLVTVPNSTISKEMIENIGKRPYIRRVSNLTITYDTPPDKVARAVQIIKDILAATPEVNVDANFPPRVFFNEFNDCSLNILMIYWVRPPDYWLFQAVNERVNLAMMRAFAAAGIEYAFPTRTVHVKSGPPQA